MSKITKAVIPVAGWSTRFLPTVKAYAKHLVPVLDKSQIQLVVEELIGAGITDICLVYRPGERTIRRYFSPHSRLDRYLESVGKAHLLNGLNHILTQARFTFIPQSARLPYGNGSPIIAAKNFIGSDPFVYAWGDDLTLETKPGNFLKKLISTYEKYLPAVVLATQKFSPTDIERVASIKYVKDAKYPHRISAILEKLPASEAPSLFGNCARFIVTPDIIPILEQRQLGRGNELWFTNAVNTLAQDHIVMTVDHRQYDSLWTTTGDPLNWLLVNLTLGLRDPRFADSIKNHLANIGTHP